MTFCLVVITGAASRVRGLDRFRFNVLVVWLCLIAALFGAIRLAGGRHIKIIVRQRDGVCTHIQNRLGQLLYVRDFEICLITIGIDTVDVDFQIDGIVIISCLDRGANNR